jgi:PAS domain S-box-containing protein
MKKKKPFSYSALNHLPAPVLPASAWERHISETLKDIRSFFDSPFCWMSLYLDGSLTLKSSGASVRHKRLMASKFLARISPRILKGIYPLTIGTGSKSIGQIKVILPFLREQSFDRLMGAPLLQANQFMGTLNVVREKDSADFTSRDLKSLRLLAEQIALTIGSLSRGESTMFFEFPEAILDHIPNPVFIKDRNHRWVFLNPALAELVGYPRERMLGKSDYDFFSRNQADFFWKKDDQMFHTGKVIDIPEELITDSQGKIHHIHTKKAPLRDASGAITHLVGIIEDITELKRTERKLIKREKISRERALLLNDLRSLYDKDQVLNRVCRAIRNSGLFERAVMTLHDSSRQITHLGQVGLPQKAVELARKSPPLDRQHIRRMMSQRFRMSDSFFLPVEAGIDLSKSDRYIPQKKTSLNGEWRMGDELFVPLRDFSGIVMGYLSVDTPTDGCRPDIKGIQSLEMLVEAAASRIRELDVQKALRDSEESYRLLVENIKEGIYSTQRGIFTSVNDSLCRMFGYAKKELIGTPAWNLVVSEKRESIKRVFAAKAVKGDFSPVEVECLRKNGSIFLAEISLSAISKKQQLLGVVSDVTERKRMEEELRQSQAMYKALIEQIPAHTYTASIDKTSSSLFISPQVEKLIGFTPEDFKRNPDLWWKKLHPYDKKRVLAELHHCHATGKPFVSEYRMIHRRGHTVWVRDEAMLVRDPKGKPLVLQGVMTDISGRKSAEEKQRKSEEKYRLVVENANEAIVVAQEGHLRFVNPKMVEILRYPEKELLSRPFAKFIHPEDRKMVVERHLKRIRGEEVPSIYEFRVIDKKRNVKWLEINAVAITWNDKPATLNFLTDITRRKLDEQLKSKYQEQKMLLELTQALSTAGDLNQLLDIATKKVTELIGIERSSIVLVNPDGKSATFSTLYARKGKANAKLLGYTFKSDTFARLKRLILTKPFVVNDTSLLPRGSFLKNFFKQLGVRSNLSVALISRNNFLGSINIATREKPHVFSTAEIRLLQMIANTIAVIIENYKFLEDLKSQSRRLDVQLKEQKMLFELTQALSFATDINQLRKISVQAVAKLMHAERVGIGIITPKGDSLSVSDLFIKGKLGHPYSISLIKPTFVDQIKGIMSKKQPTVVNDTSIYPAGSLERGIISKRGIKSALGVPLTSHGKVFGFLAISSLSKLHYYTQQEIQLLQTISNPIAMAIENRLLLENLQTQKVNLEKQTQEKDILLKVSQALSQTMDLDRVAHTASEVVGKALGVDRCSVILLTEDGHQVEIKGIFSKHGTTAKKLLGKRYPIENESNWRNIIVKRKTLVMNDVAAARLDGVIKEHHTKEGLKSLVVTGIFFGTKLLGVLSLSSVTKIRSFARDELQLAQAIANQIAVAIENARLMEVVKVHTHELKELSSQLMQAQEGERKRIAQELHDQVGQMLQTMKMNLDRMKKNLSLEPQKLEETKEWLMDTEQKLSQTIDDIRTLTFNLRPSMLDDFGLFSTLRWYIEDYSRRANVMVTLKGKEDRYRFPLEIEVNLYRIIQEALTNVVKHANATEVTIFLFHKKSCAILSIKDNGQGFDSSKLTASPHKGTGIYNMKERVNLLGGSFEIISRPGKGTRINVNIPFTEVRYEESQIIDR